MIVKIKDCVPRKAIAVGATLAEQHMTGIRAAIDGRTLRAGSTVILDFGAIAAVNASYIKGTAYWLLLCAQLANRPELQELSGRHPSDPRPYSLFVAVSNLGTDVEAEFLEFYRGRQAALLVATRYGEEEIVAARLEGHLDGSLKKALSALTTQSGGTAPQLHLAHPNEQVSVTAWNNRLSDLAALGLVRRRRVGKTWEYDPIATEITYGRSLS